MRDEEPAGRQCAYAAVPESRGRLLSLGPEEEALHRPRPAWRTRAVTALLVSGLVASGGAAHLCTRGGGLRWRQEAPLLGESENVCGRPEKDVEYRTGTSLFELGNVSSAEKCLSACDGNEQCRAWAWKAQNGAVSAGVCSLKGLKPDQEPERHRRRGVVSGRKCSMAEVARRHAAAFRAPASESRSSDAAGDKGSASGLATSCGPALDGVDFWTKLPLYQRGGVEEAEGCCKLCQEELTCWAWTWGKSSAVDGLANVCFLKGLGAPGERPDKHPNPQVVSGSTCRTMDNHPMACDSALEPAAHCDQIEDNLDYWTEKSLTQTGAIATAEDCRKTCASTVGCGAWTWGKDSAEPGLAKVCFLKGLRIGEEPEEHHNSHVKSGRLCQFRPFSAKVTTTTTATSVAAEASGDTSRHSRERNSSSSSSSSHDGNSSTISSTPTIHTTKTITDTTTTTRTTTSSSSSSSTSSTSSTSSNSDSSSTSTTSATSSTVTLRNTTTREPYKPNSIYCFALVQPSGYELDLIAHQYKAHVSIFACDESVVLSNKVIEIAPGLKTAVVDSSLRCQKGGEFMTALNTEIFFAVWDKIISDGRFDLHAWTVKVDADCVFLPSRLRQDLEHHYEGPTGVYINNCKMGLHGPLEVFSRIAVHLWAEGRQRCVDHFTKLCSGPCLWGEDMFIDQCLSKVLGVRRDDDWSLLVEDHCAPPEGWDNCLDVTKAAFHPFKDDGDWRRCMYNAGGYLKDD